MRIAVRRFATLRDYGPVGEDPLELHVPHGACVTDVLARLGIPDEMEKVILVSGRHARGDTALQEGDVVTLFPPVEGG